MILTDASVMNPLFTPFFIVAGNDYMAARPMSGRIDNFRLCCKQHAVGL